MPADDSRQRGTMPEAGHRAPRRHALGALTPRQGRLRLLGAALLGTAAWLALAGYLAQGAFKYWAGIGSAGLLLVVLILAMLDMRAIRRHFRQERAKLFRRTLEGREEESGGMVP